MKECKYEGSKAQNPWFPQSVLRAGAGDRPRAVEYRLLVTAGGRAGEWERVLSGVFAGV